jgi:hypothetical protein
VFGEQYRSLSYKFFSAPLLRWSKFSRQNSILKHDEPAFLPEYLQPSLYTHTINRQN